MSTEKRQQNPRKDERVEVETPLGAVSCVLPGIWEWDTFIAKLRAGDIAPARRELIQLCSANGTDLGKVFARFPALPEEICDELGRLVGDSNRFDPDFDSGTLVVNIEASNLTFTAPAQADYELAEADVKRNQKANPGQAIRALCLSCIDPTQTEEARHVFERYPGLAGPIYNALGVLAGKELKIVAKKGVSSSGEQSKTLNSQPAASLPTSTAATVS